MQDKIQIVLFEHVPISATDWNTKNLLRFGNFIHHQCLQSLSLYEIQFFKSFYFLYSIIIPLVLQIFNERPRTFFIFVYSVSITDTFPLSTFPTLSIRFISYRKRNSAKFAHFHSSCGFFCSSIASRMKVGQFRAFR